LLALELALRYRFLEPFYSDAGTLPSDLLRDKVDSLYLLLCLHCHFGRLWQQQLLLTLQLVVAVLFAFGVGTPWTALLSWYLYASLTLRNTWLNYILDRYFHYLLLLSVFLPLQRRRQRKTEDLVVSPATVALKALVVWIYLDAGLGKYLDPLGGWSWNARPLPALDTYTRHTVAAQYLYALLQPVGGFRILTPAVVYAELLAAPIALASSYFGRRRLASACVGVVWSLHAGIALALRNAAMLSWVACAAWIPFVVVPSPPASAKDRQKMPPPAEVAAAPTSVRSRQRAAQWIVSFVSIVGVAVGNLWFETVGCDGSSSSSGVQTVWSTLLHNRWNVFVGAEEYVTWEIAPGLLQDGSVVDVWGRRADGGVDWSMPGTGAPSTATSRPGRWRSFPYLAELQGRDGEALWGYLCREWDRDHRAADNPGRRLVRYNFFMLQADVLPNMTFGPTRKRLIRAYECSPSASGASESQAEVPSVEISNAESEVLRASSDDEL
jgi:hypothetical protein